ncbi:hypothetical protein CR513_31728, partial [Mucuna pruriens]
MGHSREDWYEFHHAAGHSTEGCWTLKTQLEKLVQEGRLNQYVQHQANDVQGDRRGRGRSNERPTLERELGGIGGAHGNKLTPLGRRRSSNSVITFDSRDLRCGAPGCDEPMFIFVVVAEYKIEWTRVAPPTSCTSRPFERWGCDIWRSAKEYFTVSRVNGCQSRELSSWRRSGVRIVLVLYTVVDVEASYNIIMRRPVLNRFGAVVSTYHLYMKFSVGQEVDLGVARRCYKDSLRVRSTSPGPAVNVLDLDLDPRYLYENERPYPGEELKEVTKIGTTLGPDEEAWLVDSLRRNVDVFAWTTKDMPGIDPDFMCHCLLVVRGARPVAQKRRKQGEEKVETRKLLAVGFIKEVQYPTWLANVVMVRKANDRWRMSTDYTDLNKACPKDPYPLPSIDRLVDGVSSFALLSCIDAYSGCNQIWMNPRDEEKTTFITEEGAFCYKVMPFGLKNVVATYQRLMEKVFQEVLGVDVKVYVDDMVVKSTKTGEYCKALDILRKHQLRLNPETCSFGAHARKFLGFMLTKRGIEANPDKCQAVISMRSL